jgi:hypothetical protein
MNNKATPMMNNPLLMPMLASMMQQQANPAMASMFTQMATMLPMAMAMQQQHQQQQVVPQGTQPQATINPAMMLGLMGVNPCLYSNAMGAAGNHEANRPESGNLESMKVDKPSMSRTISNSGTLVSSSMNGKSSNNCGDNKGHAMSTTGMEAMMSLPRNNSASSMKSNTAGQEIEAFLNSVLVSGQQQQQQHQQQNFSGMEAMQSQMATANTNGQSTSNSISTPVGVSMQSPNTNANATMNDQLQQLNSLIGLLSGGGQR